MELRDWMRAKGVDIPGAAKRFDLDEKRIKQLLEPDAEPSEEEGKRIYTATRGCVSFQRL